MSSQAPAARTPASKGGKDKLVKLGFAVAAVAIMAAIYFGVQRENVQLPEEWGDDLPKALATAKAENRRVLLFVDSATSSPAARQMVSITLSKRHNRVAIEQGKFVPVAVTFTEELGRKYGIEAQILPVTAILSPEGELIRSRSGYIGEVPFRRDFLQVDGSDPNEE